MSELLHFNSEIVIDNEEALISSCWDRLDFLQLNLKEGHFYALCLLKFLFSNLNSYFLGCLPFIFALDHQNILILCCQRDS